jgi:hypothetical protein
MSFNQDTTTKLANWSQKTGTSVQDLTSKLQQCIATEKTKNPAATPQALEAKARGMLFAQLKKENAGFSSPAIVFRGIVLGKSEPFDIAARQHETARAKFATNQATAIAAYTQAKQLAQQKANIPPAISAQLCTDENGVAIDTRATWAKSGDANPNFLKPLPEHSWISNIFGVAGPTQPDNATVAPFRMALTNDRALQVCPIGSPVEFRANPKNADAVQAGTANAYQLNDSTTTQFNVDTSGKVPTAQQVMSSVKALDSYKCVLGDLETYHMKTASDYNRVVIVEGVATQVNDNPLGTRGTYRFTLDDESLGFEDNSRGITVWVPQHLSANYNFGEGSTVTVVASTQEQNAYDYEKRMPDPTKKEIALNALGLICDPELIVPKNEVPQMAGGETVQM